MYEPLNTREVQEEICKRRALWYERSGGKSPLELIIIANTLYKDLTEFRTK